MSYHVPNSAPVLNAVFLREFIAAIPPFHPPRWLANAHQQTLFGLALFRTVRPEHTQLRLVPVSDGDEVAIHENHCPGATRIVILVHGLSGSHDSPYVRRLGYKLNAYGLSVIRMDQRGCGAGRARASQVFHGARYDDLLSVVNDVVQRYPNQRIMLCGFSLGANLVLRLLGTRRDVLANQVDAAVAVAPPIDLNRCVFDLQRGFARMYDVYFVRHLWNDYWIRVGRGLLPSIGSNKRPRTLYELDSMITAPLGGFASAEDYYASASSEHVLRYIDRPTLIISSTDDPLISARMLKSSRRSDFAQVHLTAAGGHLGFYASRASGKCIEPAGSSASLAMKPDMHWLDWRILDMALQLNH